MDFAAQEDILSALAADGLRPRLSFIYELDDCEMDMDYVLPLLSKGPKSYREYREYRWRKRNERSKWRSERQQCHQLP